MMIFFLLALFSSLIIFALTLSHVMALRRAKTYPPTDNFSVAVIVPCKGNDEPDFGQNLLSIIQQNYRGPAQFVFCVESQTDSALPVLHRLEQQFEPVQVCVAGLASRSAQKTHNLLAGMAQAGEVDIYLFADADIQPHPTWLQEMVAPFQDSRVGATTGCFRRVPVTDDFSWGVYWAGLFGASITTGMSNNWIKGLWGGSLAVRKTIVDQYQLRDRLATEIVDDISIMHTLRQHGLERRYVSSCTLKSYCDMSATDSLEWFTRQIQFSQIYFKGMYALFYVMIIPYALSILTAPLVLFYGLIEGNRAAVGGSTTFLLGVMLSGWLLRLGIPVNPASVTDGDKEYHLLLWLLATPVAYVAGLVALLKTIPRTRWGVLTMYWRNIEYRVEVKTGKVLEVRRKETEPLPPQELPQELNELIGNM